MKVSKTPKNRWQINKEHWNAVATVKNLKGNTERVNWEKERQLYRSADVTQGYSFLEPLAGKVVVDLGGGVGLSAHDFLDRGARVLIVDVSIARCKIAQKHFVAQGFQGEIQCIVAAAQALPLAAESVDRLWTKSVLIHTPLKRTAKELARVLKPGGKAWFVEPMRRNPFVNLYRMLQAPQIWQQITTYFSPREFRLLRRAFRQKGFSTSTSVYYFFGFFAFVFSFLISSPTLFRLAEKFFGTADSILFSLLPGIKRFAWFGALAVTKNNAAK
ncbi:MAG: methyltransferase domain-containing protein [Sumerlaeia bacterium]